MEDGLAKRDLHENPLVPNARLREMFVAMTEMRLLDEYAAGLKHGKKAGRAFDSIRGQEACRVSTAIALEEGDLVIDGAAGVVMEPLFGTKAGEALKKIQELRPAKDSEKKAASHAVAGRLLPAVEDAEERLTLALGVALSFKSQKKTSLVVAYVKRGELSGGAWKRALTMAAQYELPVLFVALPDGEKKAGDPAAKARTHGVPGVPVDASDAVALYRVAQESVVRMRGGGGAVLIDGVELETKKGVADPLEQMRQFLLGRKVGTESWMDRAGEPLRKRIAALSKS